MQEKTIEGKIPCRVNQRPVQIAWATPVAYHDQGQHDLELLAYCETEPSENSDDLIAREPLQLRHERVRFPYRPSNGHPAPPRGWWHIVDRIFQL